MQPPEIVVSYDPPHWILATGCSSAGILGYVESHIHSRTLKLFYGPRTNSLRLSAAIKNSALQRSSVSILVDLYESSGHCRNMLVTCSPFCDYSGAPVGCKLQIEDSEALSLDSALDGHDCPKALLSADAPQHPIQLLNSKFELAFGHAPMSCIGRSPDSLVGPSSPPDSLSALAAAAARACRAARGSVWVRTAAGAEVPAAVTCVPVADPLAGRVSHVLALFAPPSAPPPPAHRDAAPARPAASGFFPPEPEPWSCEAAAMELASVSMPAAEFLAGANTAAAAAVALPSRPQPPQPPPAKAAGSRPRPAGPARAP